MGARYIKLYSFKIKQIKMYVDIGKRRKCSQEVSGDFLKSYSNIAISGALKSFSHLLMEVPWEATMTQLYLLGFMARIFGGWWTIVCLFIVYKTPSLTR